MKVDAGRVIAYVGGSGVSAVSQTSKASAAAVMDISPSPGEVVSLLNAPWFEMGGVHVVTADVVSVGGLVFVGLRLAFDIWKHFDNRRRERNGQQESD